MSDNFPVISKHIAVVDDEPDIVELVAIHLKKNNFDVSGFNEASSFFKFMENNTPSLIILDLMLPDADGFEICKTLRANEKYAHIPIIMLTAKSEETDKIVGLEIGADDYVTKPFSPKELVARVKAVLRRTETAKKTLESKKLDVANIITIDTQKFEVHVKNEKVDLTSTEFRILLILSKRIGWVFSRKQILDALWGIDKAATDRTVDVHIRHIREKLGEASYLVKNVRGLGYKISEEA